jgi:hypothetical protein
LLSAGGGGVTASCHHRQSTVEPRRAESVPIHSGTGPSLCSVREGAMKVERSHGRHCRVFARIGLVLSLLLVAVWSVSVLWRMGYETRSRTSMSFSSGCIRIVHIPPVPGSEPDGWFCKRSRWPQQWLPRYRLVRYDECGTSDKLHLWVCVPIWILLVVAAIPTVSLWRRGCRPPVGHCQRCGYDLTGNLSGVCPECGTNVPTPR